MELFVFRNKIMIKNDYGISAVNFSNRSKIDRLFYFILLFFKIGLYITAVAQLVRSPSTKLAGVGSNPGMGITFF